MRVCLLIFILVVNLYSVDNKNVGEATKMVDVANRTIILPKKVETIALSSARVFPIFDIIQGGKDIQYIVAMRNDMKVSAPTMYDYYTSVYPSLSKIKDIGLLKAGSFNLEDFLINVHPDVFFVDISNFSAVKDIGFDKFKKVGTEIVFIDFRENPVKNTLKSIRIIGQVLGREEVANEYINIYNNKLRRLKETLSRTKVKKRILIERASGYRNSEYCCYIFARENMGGFIDVLGSLNIGAQIFGDVGAEITIEKILIEQPEILIMSSSDWAKNNSRGIPLGYRAKNDNPQIKERNEALLNRNFMKHLEAYETRDIYVIYMPLYNSAMNIIAYEFFAKWIAPDLFKDLDPNKTFTDLYKKFTGRNVTGVLGFNSFTYKSEK